MMRGEPVDAAKVAQAESIDLKNIKDDIILMQFKLVRKENMKILNTISFANYYALALRCARKLFHQKLGNVAAVTDVAAVVKVVVVVGVVSHHLQVECKC